MLYQLKPIGKSCQPFCASTTTFRLNYQVEFESINIPTKTQLYVCLVYLSPSRWPPSSQVVATLVQMLRAISMNTQTLTLLRALVT